MTWAQARRALEVVLPVVAFVAMLSTAAWAQSTTREISFRTRPGGSVAYDGETEVARTADEQATASFIVQADTSSSHHFRLLRPPFDEITFTLRWNDVVGRWQFADGGRGGEFLGTNERIDFSRTIRLNVTPSGARAFLEAESGPTTREEGSVESEQVVAVAGLQRQVIPLRADQSGRWELPSAWQPPPILLVRDGFEPSILIFAEGELDAPGDLFPTHAHALKPLFGPFSYWQFNLGAGLVTISALAVWMIVVRPRVERRRRATEGRLAVADRIIAAAESASDNVDIPPLVGRKMITERGREILVLGQLGAGAMGAVFEASLTGDGEPESVAVKVLQRSAWQSEEFRLRFQREIEICSRLHHPGIVKTMDWGCFRLPDRSGSDAIYPFMVMELVSGEELRCFIKPGQPLPVAQVLGWLREILAALRVAHAAGVVHRDLKPENIRVTDAGHVKLLDFGIARTCDASGLTQTHVAMGTPRYMSPEHLDSKRVTAASDIYSVGVIAYEMLTGVPPFDDEDPWKLLHKMMTQAVLPISTFRADVPGGLAHIVAKMMARRPIDRYASTDDVLRELQAC